jgi:recombinational DNA repair protein RecT
MSNKLQMTQSALQQAPNLKALFELDAFRNNYVTNYSKTTGKKDGDMVFEREKILFMKAIQAQPKLEKCDRFTIYSAFIELAASGLSLNDGEAFIIPYGTVAQFQPGWKGRLNQMSMLPYIKYVNDPVVVYESDEFDYEIVNGVTHIKKHKPNLKRVAGEAITFVYLSIETDHGFKIHLMSAADVYSIRDRYSQTYKQYMIDIAAKGLKLGDSFKKTITGRNGSFEVTVEPPFWVTDEPRAFKKTLVKRVWNSIPKTERMKKLDEKIKNNFDPETGEVFENTEEIDYGIVQDDAGLLPEETPKYEEKFTVKATSGENATAHTVKITEEKQKIENPLEAF